MVMIDRSIIKRDATSFPFLDYFNSLVQLVPVPSLTFSPTDPLRRRLRFGAMGSRDFNDGMVPCSHTEEDGGGSPTSTVMDLLSSFFLRLWFINFGN